MINFFFFTRDDKQLQSSLLETNRFFFFFLLIRIAQNPKGLFENPSPGAIEILIPGAF